MEQVFNRKLDIKKFNVLFIKKFFYEISTVELQKIIYLVL